VEWDPEDRILLINVSAPFVMFIFRQKRRDLPLCPQADEFVFIQPEPFNKRVLAIMKIPCPAEHHFQHPPSRLVAAGFQAQPLPNPAPHNAEQL